MTTKKTKALKKTSVKTKRPPRMLWLVYPPDGGEGFTVGTKAAAEKNASGIDTVVGPYILAERVRQK